MFNLPLYLCNDLSPPNVWTPKPDGRHGIALLQPKFFRTATGAIETGPLGLAKWTWKA